MSDAPLRTAAALRQAFDASFAEPPELEAPIWDELLAIRIGDDPHAIRLSQIAAVHADRKIVSVPSGAGALLGIAALRSGIVPVYDLRALLGYRAGGAPRWLVVSSGSEPVGLAFDGVDGHLRAPRSDISLLPARSDRVFVRGVVRAGELVRPLIDVGTVIDAISSGAEALARQARSGGPSQDG